MGGRVVGVLACAFGLALALTECVGDNPDVEAAGEDSGIDTAQPPPGEDAGASDGSCWNRKFGQPVLVEALSSPLTDLRVTFAPDERVAYLASDRASDAGNMDLYIATRPTTSDPWEVPVPMVALNTSTNEIHPAIAPDNRALYFASLRADASVGATDLYRSVRGGIEPFTTIELVPVVNSALLEHSPYPTQNSLFFSSLRNGELQIFEATKNGTSFAAPLELTAVNQAGSSTQDPVATSDGLVLFFSSTRANGLGDFDIWVTTRASLSSPFDAPVNVVELNTASIDRPSWISPDGCRMYLTSSRPGGPGLLDTWMASR
jgi:Tol biopolymer transport system component